MKEEQKDPIPSHVASGTAGGSGNDGTDRTSPTPTADSAAPATRRPLRVVWFALAFIILGVILALPLEGDALGWQGQVALALLGFAVVMWVTEAVSYQASAAILIVLIAILIGFSQDPETSQAVGTSEALRQAMSGFSSPGVSLVAAALFLAAAMQATGLHKRIALIVLKLVGDKTSNVVIGAILISVVLAFFVPSATARGGAIVPILLGMVAAFGMKVNSNLSALLIVTAAQSISIWNVGVKTAAAQNLVAIGFIEESTGQTVSWGNWFLYAAPWSVLMSVALFFIMRATIHPEVETISGGRAMVTRQLEELGPLQGRELRLMVVSLILLALWATEGILHPIDSSTVTLAAIAFLLLPRVGVFSWREAEPRVNWGTLVVFAVGISLGSLLLKTGAAEWLSDTIFGSIGLDQMPLLAAIALVSLFNIVIHLGFASATALASALIPVFIALGSALPTPDDAGIGFVIIQQFVISFGFILPISAPQNMLAYGTGAFTSKQFIKTGIPLVVVGYLLIVLLSATYWRWIGLV